MAVMLMASLIVTLQRQAGVPRAGNIATLVWKADGDWVIETVEGKSFDAQLQPSSYVHPWLVVLNFRLEKSRRLRSIVIFPDTLDVGVFRELRVRLGIEGGRQADDN